MNERMKEINEYIEKTFDGRESHAKMFYLGDGLYHLLFQIYGQDPGAGDYYDVITADVLYNVKTREMTELATFSPYENPLGITSEELLQWITITESFYRSEKREVIIYSNYAEIINNLPEIEIKDAEYTESEYTHSINFTIEDSPLSFEYSHYKKSEHVKLGLSVDLDKEIFISQGMFSTKVRNEMLEKVKEHKKVRLHTVTKGIFE